jgi:release factor glutamine methyltransferase
MTYRALIQTLSAAKIPDAGTDARLLLSHFFGADAASILAHPDRDYESEAFAKALARRIRREPLQHILGEAYFFGNRFFVSPDCLIPRADTEILVEEACRVLPEGAHFADLCTGSGCIALSVLLARPDTTALLVDISSAALAVAKRNAEALGVSDRATFLLADVLTEELSLPAYILSNPPYIESGVIPTLAPELAHEPAIALDGGEDGLLFYRQMIARFSPALFLFEIGYDQGEALPPLGEARGYATKIRKDLGGCDRLAILKKR